MTEATRWVKVRHGFYVNDHREGDVFKVPDRHLVDLLNTKAVLPCNPPVQPPCKESDD